MLAIARDLLPDFEKCVNRTQAGDFVYLDPPYAVSSRRLFRQYGPCVFDLDDLPRLVASLERAESRGVDFVVSYAMCSEALDIFSRWKIRRVTVQRNISGFSSDRKRAVELLITNTDIEAQA